MFKKSICTSQETRYISVTKTNRLLLNLQYLCGTPVHGATFQMTGIFISICLTFRKFLENFCLMASVRGIGFWVVNSWFI